MLDLGLTGLNAAGDAIWHFSPRLWDASKIHDEFLHWLEPADPWPAWECVIDIDTAKELRARYGKDQLVGLEDKPQDLDELFGPPTDRVKLLIFEWGYG